MQTKSVATILLVACLVITGCSSVKATPEPQPTPTPSAEILPGVYMSNDPSDFPFPTSGYTVYIVGESHGNRETKQAFQSYLERLYKEAGLRDVILEEDQAYETDANAYVHGSTDELIKGLCLRADILGRIREFNQSLPEDEKVVVHLVDVDSPFPTIHKHLTDLHKQIGPAADSIAIPHSSDFRNMSSEQRQQLIKDLQEASSDQPETINSLETVALSLEWFFLGNRMDIVMPFAPGGRALFAPLREDVITKNIEYVVSRLNGRPVLAFFGADHARKNTGSEDLPAEGFKTWTHRLIDSGVNVYSLVIHGIKGNGYWRGDAFSYELKGEQQYEGVSGYRFEEGTSLVSLFEGHPDSGIMYADLRVEKNATIQLPPGYVDVPASQVFDGLIFFREFTPMENACPE